MQMENILSRDFKIYLLRNNPELYLKIAPYDVLSADNSYNIKSYSIKGKHYNEEDWIQALSHWEGFLKYRLLMHKHESF